MDLSISEMMTLQQRLYEPHRDEWPPMEPEYAKDYILYMMEEVGEVIAIMKKKGGASVVEDAAVRSRFLEEMADVLMYYNDILLRCHVTAEEISQAYQAKFEKNMRRNYRQQYEEMYHDGQN